MSPPHGEEAPLLAPVVARDGGDQLLRKRNVAGNVADDALLSSSAPKENPPADDDSDHDPSYDASTTTTHDNNVTGILAYPPFTWILGFYRLFFTWKFIVHRLLGLAFIVQWLAAFTLYFYDYNYFKHSFLVWSLPLTSFIQPITAALTFTFLSKNKVDQGYFSDKQTISYPFVLENSFFAMISLFQWVYMDDRFYPLLTKSFFIEASLVFIPYYFRDLYWPKTSFRDSYASDSTSQRTSQNKQFFSVAITVTKAFYIWAKHFMGLYLNYTRYLNRITPDQIRHVDLGNIFGVFAITIGVFLHTLKFKKYIGPRTAFLIYAASYMATFYTFVRIAEVFTHHLDLTIITLIGVLLNFGDRRTQHLYQVAVFALLAAARYGYLPEGFHERFGFAPGHVFAGI